MPPRPELPRGPISSHLAAAHRRLGRAQPSARAGYPYSAAAPRACPDRAAAVLDVYPCPGGLGRGRRPGRPASVTDLRLNRYPIVMLRCRGAVHFPDAMIAAPRRAAFRARQRPAPGWRPGRSRPRAHPLTVGATVPAAPANRCGRPLPAVRLTLAILAALTRQHLIARIGVPLTATLAGRALPGQLARWPAPDLVEIATRSSMPGPNCAARSGPVIAAAGRAEPSNRDRRPGRSPRHCPVRPTGPRAAPRCADPVRPKGARADPRSTSP